jgi:hypothetical protein
VTPTESAAMTALSLASIPSNINSYERLLVWSAQALQSAANGATLNAIQGAGSQPTVQVQVVVAADNSDRFVVSAFIPLDRNGLNDPDEKSWMAAQDVTVAAPHANFGSN